MTAATTPDERWRLGYRPGLDGLRGVAVLLVMGQHAEAPILGLSGATGVTVFFVLSGFLITTLLLEERQRTGGVNLAAFWMRRARRLLPALALFLAAAVIFGASAAVIVSTALYFANWVFAIAGPDPAMIHVWSLSVEEQFYIAWPLLFLALVRLPRWAMLVVLLEAIAAVTGSRVHSELVADDRNAWTFFTTHHRADAILWGCALAVSFSIRPWKPSRWLILAAVVLLGWVALDSDREAHILYGLSAAALASTVLVAGAAQLNLRWLTWRPLVYIGTISYGLYLWHHPLSRWGRDTEIDPIGMIGLMVLSVGIAAASYHLVERRFLRTSRQGAASRGTAPRG